MGRRWTRIPSVWWKLIWTGNWRCLVSAGRRFLTPIGRGIGLIICSGVGSLIFYQVSLGIEFHSVLDCVNHSQDLAKAVFDALEGLM